MSIESEIMNRLQTFAGITALVGAGDNARIYPMAAPEGALKPYIVYSLIGSGSGTHLSGASGLGDRLYQFNCVDINKLGVVNLAEQVRVAMNGWRDTDTSVRDARSSGVTDVRNNPIAGRDKPIFERIVDISLSVFESTL